MVEKRNKPGRQLTLVIAHLLIILQVSYGQDLFFEKIHDPQSAIDTRIIGITKDSLSYLWIGTWNGVYRYDGERFESFKFPLDETWSISNNRLRNIITDQNKQVWILTSDRKYIRYGYAQHSFERIAPELVPDSVKMLLDYSPNELNKKKYIDQVRFFIEQNYFCSIDEKTDKKTVYYPDIYQSGHLTDEYVSAFYIDNQDIIWLGTQNGKIYKANTSRNPFNLHSIYKEGKRTPIPTAVNSIFKDDNKLWLGTEYDGIFVRDERTGDFIEHPVNTGRVKIARPRVIQKDGRGNVWIGTMDGLYHYDPLKEQTKVILDIRTKPEVYNPQVYSISTTADGYLWAGIYQGLARINTQSLAVQRYDYHREFERRAVRDLIVDAKNQVWAGTEGYCLFRFTYDAEGVCTDTFRIKDFKKLTQGKLDGDCIYTMYEDREGEIWVGTTEGLFRIDPTLMEVDLYSEVEGLPDLYITAITEDKRGNIWVSHKKGISKIHQKDGSISNYLIAGNSGNWIFKEGACYNDWENNIIYFGANEGYVSFVPDEIANHPYAPRLLLSQLYVSGNQVNPNQAINNRIVLQKALCLTDKVTLDYDIRDFGIDLSALNFQNTIGHTYKYQLLGYQESWLSTKYRHVSFMKVPPGEYIFNAKAISSDGKVSNTVSLEIVIHPPWYATPLAILSYIIIFGLIAFFGHRVYRSRQELKKQLLIERLHAEKQQEITKERLEFFTNVSHELRTPLSLIVDPLQQLKSQNMAAEKQSRYIRLISKQAEHLSKLVNQILDFRKVESNKMFPEYAVLDGVEVMNSEVMKFELLAKERSIQLDFRSSKRELVGNFDEEKLRQIVQTSFPTPLNIHQTAEV